MSTQFTDWVRGGWLEDYQAPEQANDWERSQNQRLQENRQQDRQKIRELEKDVSRKDKALAETAALLVLQKKLQAIWGDEDV